MKKEKKEETSKKISRGNKNFRQEKRKGIKTKSN
jgi:hypothetical protein